MKPAAREATVKRVITTQNEATLAKSVLTEHDAPDRPHILARHEVGLVTVYTPKQVGEILGSAPETIIRWIREGQLKASNLATGSRPRFVIRPVDVDDFLIRRQIDTPGNAVRPRRLPRA